MDDLIETMTSALRRFSTGEVVQPVRPTIVVDEHSFFGTMPAYVRGQTQVRPRSDLDLTLPTDSAAMGAKLVTVFGGNAAQGLHSHLASIVLMNPETGALQALLDGRFITEARTAAVSAVSSRLLSKKTAQSLAIIGSGVQARSHLDALSRVHRLRQVTVWSPNKLHREVFVEEARTATEVRPRSDLGLTLNAVDHAGEAIVGADIIVLATSSPTPVIENGWVKPGAHVISVGACRPNQREMDPPLVARARLFVDSRAAALVESGDVVMGIQEARFTAAHVVAELGELLADPELPRRRTDTEVTIFKSLGLAVEDVTAAQLALQRAEERGVGQELTL
jgi:ornithine cyclodeaminase